MQSSLYLLFEPYSIAVESRLLDLSSNIQGFLAEFMNNHSPIRLG